MSLKLKLLTFLLSLTFFSQKSFADNSEYPFFPLPGEEEAEKEGESKRAGSMTPVFNYGMLYHLPPESISARHTAQALKSNRKRAEAEHFREKGLTSNLADQTRKLYPMPLRGGDESLKPRDKKARGPAPQARNNGQKTIKRKISGAKAQSRASYQSNKQQMKSQSRAARGAGCGGAFKN